MFFKDASHYLWDDPYLFKVSTDGLIRRCVAGEEANSIMWHCHSSAYGTHHSGERTTAKVLQNGFWWPTLFKDGQDFVKRCDKFQRTGNISKRNEMLLTGIIEVEPFDCWDHSLPLTFFSIYLCVLTMPPNELKQYLVLLMMLRLLSTSYRRIFSLGLEPLES